MDKKLSKDEEMKLINNYIGQFLGDDDEESVKQKIMDIVRKNYTNNRESIQPISIGELLEIDNAIYNI